MKIVRRNVYYDDRLVTLAEAAAALGIHEDMVRAVVAEKRVLPADTEPHAREKWRLHEVHSAVLARIADAHPSEKDDSPTPLALTSKTALIEAMGKMIARYRNASPEALARFLYDELDHAMSSALFASGSVRVFGLGTLRVTERGEKKVFSRTTKQLVDVPAGHVVKYTRSRAVTEKCKEHSGNE